MTVKGRRAFKPRTAAIAQKPGHLWHNWVTPGGVGGLSLGGCGCVQQGVKWRGHRPPTLARSVLAQLFSVQSRPSGCSSGGGAGPTAHGAAAIPTVGPAAASCHCTQSNTRPPHCSVCCHQTNLHLRDEKQEGGEVEKSSLFLAGLDNNCSQGRPARATFFFFRVM